VLIRHHPGQGPSTLSPSRTGSASPPLALPLVSSPAVLHLLKVDRSSRLSYAQCPGLRLVYTHCQAGTVFVANHVPASSYTISTAAFLYSPTIRSQYAYRHPAAPETTVRFNDFLFAAHGAVMCVIIYSQFFPSLWGFRVSSKQRASKAALGIFWGCVLAIIVVVFLARVVGKDVGYDPSGWAWIDVVGPTSYEMGVRG